MAAKEPVRDAPVEGKLEVSVDNGLVPRLVSPPVSCRFEVGRELVIPVD